MDGFSLINVNTEILALYAVDTARMHVCVFVSLKGGTGFKQLSSKINQFL